MIKLDCVAFIFLDIQDHDHETIFLNYHSTEVVIQTIRRLKVFWLIRDLETPETYAYRYD